MTQGDIHNISQMLQRQKISIRNYSQISERDKKILIECNSNFPSFLNFMLNKYYFKKGINRYVLSYLWEGGTYSLILKRKGSMKPSSIVLTFLISSVSKSDPCHRV